MDTMRATLIKAAMVFLAAQLAPVSTSLLDQTLSPASQSQFNDGDVATLKAQLAEQQKQIDELKLALQDQKKSIERVNNSAPALENRHFALPRNNAKCRFSRAGALLFKIGRAHV